jgi:protease II
MEYDHSTRNTRMLSEVKLKGKPPIKRSEFEFKEFLVPSHDGEEVPLLLTYKKGAVELNRRNRILMEAYGTYGISMEQDFSIVKTCAMEKGWILAEAMVRGGGEKGV